MGVEGIRSDRGSARFDRPDGSSLDPTVVIAQMLGVTVIKLVNGNPTIDDMDLRRRILSLTEVAPEKGTAENGHGAPAPAIDTTVDSDESEGVDGGEGDPLECDECVE